MWTCLNPTGRARPIVRWSLTTSQATLPAPARQPLARADVGSDDDFEDSTDAPPYHLPPVAAAAPAMPLWPPAPQVASPRRAEVRESATALLPPLVRDAMRHFEDAMRTSAVAHPFDPAEPRRPVEADSSSAAATSEPTPLTRPEPSSSAPESSSTSGDADDTDDDPFIRELASLVSPFLADPGNAPSPDASASSTLELSKVPEEQQADHCPHAEGANVAPTLHEQDPHDNEDESLSPSPYQTWLQLLDTTLERHGGVVGVLPTLLSREPGSACLRLEELPERATQRLLEARLLVDSPDGYRAHPSLLATATGWRDVLDGVSRDLGPCGDLPLDAWSTHLLTALLPEAPAQALRSELRSLGVAAFGLVTG